jgi:chromate reductase
MICILCGSSRNNSNTARVGKAISRVLQHNGYHAENILMPDFTQYNIPFSNGGKLTPDNLSGFQQDVYRAISESKIIFVLSPEYNWFPTAEIINLINQFGSKQFIDCWDNKVFATVGISSGRGGRIPAVQLSSVLNKLIGFMNCHSIVSGKIFESQFTPAVLDENGNSRNNEEYDKGLEDFVSYTLDLANKFN